jgi:hypothetical protein
LRQVEDSARDVVRRAHDEGWLNLASDLDGATELQRAVNRLARKLRFEHYDGDGCLAHQSAGQAGSPRVSLSRLDRPRRPTTLGARVGIIDLPEHVVAAEATGAADRTRMASEVVPKRKDIRTLVSFEIPSVRRDPRSPPPAGWTVRAHLTKVVRWLLALAGVMRSAASLARGPSCATRSHTRHQIRFRCRRVLDLVQSPSRSSAGGPVTPDVHPAVGRISSPPARQRFPLTSRRPPDRHRREADPSPASQHWPIP